MFSKKWLKTSYWEKNNLVIDINESCFLSVVQCQNKRALPTILLCTVTCTLDPGRVSKDIILLVRGWFACLNPCSATITWNSFWAFSIAANLCVCVCVCTGDRWLIIPNSVFGIIPKKKRVGVRPSQLVRISSPCTAQESEASLCMLGFSNFNVL